MIDAEKVRCELRRLGCKFSYRGFKFLSEAVLICYSQEEALYNLQADVYPPIAAKYGANPKTVESNMRTVIANCSQEAFQEMCNEKRDGALTIKSFIESFVSYLKYKYE